MWGTVTDNVTDGRILLVSFVRSSIYETDGWSKKDGWKKRKKKTPDPMETDKVVFSLSPVTEEYAGAGNMIS